MASDQVRELGVGVAAEDACGPADLAGTPTTARSGRTRLSCTWVPDPQKLQDREKCVVLSHWLWNNLLHSNR